MRRTIVLALVFTVGVSLATEKKPPKTAINQNQPTINMVYVSKTISKNGKPTLNIMAYNNGKKLSEKEATQFYNEMLKQQRTAQKAQRRYWRRFDKLMRRQQQDMNRLFAHMFNTADASPFLLMPGPVITSEPSAHKENK